MKIMELAPLIERVIVALSSEPPEDPILNELFGELRDTSKPEVAEKLEHRIWSSWCGHDDPDAVAAMNQVIGDFQSGDLESAGKRLDIMVERWPDWAEAWNKRATLRYLEERHADSLADIIRTLELEPRHFGAISGFAQISLGAGDESSALIGLEAALQINPSMEQLRQAVATLRKHGPHTVH